ncbi:MAG: pyridoxamine 5'-phosphate oxidase [Candidatus Dasytiphilus stammeri]
MTEISDLPKIAQLRREYTRGSLRRTNLPLDPLTLFRQWLNQACAAKLPDPTAMCLATVDDCSQPWQRMVLLKHLDEQGMIFFTNLSSRKAQHLNNHPCMSLLFHWNMLERQVMVLGRVQRLSNGETENYFHSRPRDSQIGAWVSHQSNIITTRKVLERKFLKLKQQFQHQEIPLPNFWGGFRVYINAIEFWQGGEHRLHDRFFFHREGNQWKIDRLSP